MMVRAGALVCPVLVCPVSRFRRGWGGNVPDIPVFDLVQVAAANFYEPVAADKRNAAFDIWGRRAGGPEHRSERAAGKPQLRRAAIFDLDLMGSHGQLGRCSEHVAAPPNHQVHEMAPLRPQGATVEIRAPSPRRPAVILFRSMP